MTAFLGISHGCCCTPCSSIEVPENDDGETPEGWELLGSIPCQQFAGRSHKYVVSGSVSAQVFEKDDSNAPNWIQENDGSGNGNNTGSGLVPEDFPCLCNGYWPSVLTVSGPFNGEYKYYSEDGVINITSYQTNIFAAVYIALRCGQDKQVKVYITNAVATNLTSESPGTEVEGLTSSGTISFSFMGLSTSIPMYNYWVPGWSGGEGYTGTWSLTANINVDRQLCAQ